eukprot:gene9840-10850_t
MLRKEQRIDGTSQNSTTAAIRPSTSAEEWFNKEGIKEWPFPVASEGELDLSVEKLKSKDRLKEDLHSHASLEISILDDLLENIVGLEENLHKYAKHVFVIENDSADEDEDDNSQDNVTAAEFSTTWSSESWKKSKQGTHTSSRQRSVEHTSFPGFDPSELVPLPGSLEAPQLLNKITHIQNFPGTFRQVWKKYFLSEATVAIFQDAFWWWFMEKFQNIPEMQACLFDRIADSFVGLFLTIPSADKDAFFQRYADCLAQTIYAAFCQSFPLSFMYFNEEFRSDLLNIISEWTTGLRPPPNSCRAWHLSFLETDQLKLLQEDPSLSFDADEFGLRIDQTEMNLTTQTTNISQIKLRTPTTESHQAGPGPDFARVSFNLQGKSPLINHFLAANRLQFDEPAAVKKNMTRTEILKFPSLALQSSPFSTYQELIQERRQDARIANKKYSRFNFDASIGCREATNATAKKFEFIQQIPPRVVTQPVTCTSSHFIRDFSRCLRPEISDKNPPATSKYQTQTDDNIVK